MAKNSEHTFVVLAYGESPYLEECVQSVINQSQKSNVVVSTSTPSSHIMSIAEKYNLKVNVNDHKPSICADWNSALEIAGTQFITLAHQDDVYDEQYVELIMGKMLQEDRPIIGFCESGEIAHSKKVVDSRNLSVKRRLLRPLKNESKAKKVKCRRRCLSLGNPIACPSVCYNMKLLQTPVFLDNFKSNLDWQAWEKLANMEGSFVYVNKPLMWHRLHEESETSHLIENETRSQEDLEMLKKFWPTPIAKLIFSQYKKAQKGNFS